MPVYTPEKPDFNSSCPDFTLPGVNGGVFSLVQFLNKKPFLIMFICNHCPYVNAIEDRLIQLALDLKKQDMNVIAICSNDQETYPDDSLPQLQKRMLDKKYPFFYLHDESQDVAKKFGAICTPDFFVYNQEAKLSYRGRLDDSWKDETLVTSRELFTAMQELAANQPISKPQTPSAGCSIKWIKSRTNA